jgi:hypothetical protein
MLRGGFLTVLSSGDPPRAGYRILGFLGERYLSRHMTLLSQSTGDTGTEASSSHVR